MAFPAPPACPQPLSKLAEREGNRPAGWTSGAVQCPTSLPNCECPRRAKRVSMPANVRRLSGTTFQELLFMSAIRQHLYIQRQICTCIPDTVELSALYTVYAAMRL